MYVCILLSEINNNYYIYIGGVCRRAQAVANAWRAVEG